MSIIEKVSIIERFLEDFEGDAQKNIEILVMIEKITTDPFLKDRFRGMCEGIELSLSLLKEMCNEFRKIEG
jgi:hypothetical protein